MDIPTDCHRARNRLHIALTGQDFFSLCKRASCVSDSASASASDSDSASASDSGRSSALDDGVLYLQTPGGAVFARDGWGEVLRVRDGLLNEGKGKGDASEVN